MKISKISLDDKITEIILQKFKFFSLVNPNTITFFGILMNFLLLPFSKDPGFLFFTTLTLRYFADCLDGGVARKYKKVSKFGGLLDTISDNILIVILAFCICTKYEVDGVYLISAGFGLSNLLLMYYLGSITDHSNMKTGVSLGKKVYAFMVNNSFIMFILCGLAISL